MTCSRGMGIFLVLLPFCLAISSNAAAEEARSYVAPDSATDNVDRIREASIEAEESENENVDQLFLLYKEARASGLTDEADTLAKRIVNAAIEKNGVNSKVTAVALTNLGMLQVQKKENVSAVQNFSSAIEILEQIDNRLSADLIVPLKGLGRAQLQAGHPDRATDAWQRAVHITHVNFGPHNYEQVETLYSIAKLLYDAGANKAAYKIYARISYLHSRYSETDRDGKMPSI